MNHGNLLLKPRAHCMLANLTISYILKKKAFSLSLCPSPICTHSVSLSKKKGNSWGAWVAQSVKHLTVDFASGHDFTVCELKPCIRIHATVRSLLGIPSLCSFRMPSLSQLISALIFKKSNSELMFSTYALYHLTAMASAQAHTQ